MSEQRTERSVDVEDVRREHLEEVSQPAHWTYLVAVLVGGTILMLLVIALMAGVR
jgi:hypothetical protein